MQSLKYVTTLIIKIYRLILNNLNRASADKIKSYLITIIAAFAIPVAIVYAHDESLY